MFILSRIMNMNKLPIANIITAGRIFGSALMLLFPMFSVGFYSAYLLCGVSDMVDGTVARRTNGSTEFGAKLDSVADMIFLAVALFRWLPVISVPGRLWVWIAVIAAVKTSNIVRESTRKKKLVARHTIANKVTGLCLFLLPLTLSFIDVHYSVTVVCIMATFAAVQEVYYAGTDREIV